MFPFSFLQIFECSEEKMILTQKFEKHVFGMESSIRGTEVQKCQFFYFEQV
jgi:hypothetical protein